MHHTGQQVARDKITDQYAGRGGSALSDGSRMVHVMQSLTSEEWVKATGNTLQEGKSGVVYARPKITWAPPNQSPVYLKQIGYIFERFGQISSVEGAQAQLERNAEELLGHLKVKMLEGVRYSRTSIEDTDVLKTRNARRAAVRYLMANRPDPGGGSAHRRAPSKALAARRGGAFVKTVVCAPAIRTSCRFCHFLPRSAAETVARRPWQAATSCRRATGYSGGRSVAGFEAGRSELEPTEQTDFLPKNGPDKQTYYIRYTSPLFKRITTHPGQSRVARIQAAVGEDYFKDGHL